MDRSFQSYYQPIIHLFIKLLIILILNISILDQGLYNPSCKDNFGFFMQNTTMTTSMCKCARFNDRHLQPFMADLPTSRVTPSRLFLHYGVDFGRPFSIKSNHRRKSQLLKAYLCLCICFTTKAVYLECITSLSTEKASLYSLDFPSRDLLFSLILLSTIKLVPMWFILFYLS